VIAALCGFGIGVVAGSLPFAWLLHALATGRDLRREGSGNPGATNLVRSGGWMWGVAALFLDAGKGAAAVLAATWLLGSGAGVPAAVGSVAGHVFSPWLSGRGGKGVATAAGAFAVMAPTATALAVSIFALVVGTTRLVALGSVAAAVSLPCAVYVLGPDRTRFAAAAAIAALIAWRHRENFARMRAGREPRIGTPPPERGAAE
jgi:glycerol-3-phosphate acyltransferase PlsY